jgi:hypothetical protein
LFAFVRPDDCDFDSLAVAFEEFQLDRARAPLMKINAEIVQRVHRFVQDYIALISKELPARSVAILFFSML